MVVTYDDAMPKTGHSAGDEPARGQGSSSQNIAQSDTDMCDPKYHVLVIHRVIATAEKKTSSKFKSFQVRLRNSSVLHLSKIEYRTSRPVLQLYKNTWYII